MVVTTRRPAIESGSASRVQKNVAYIWSRLWRIVLCSWGAGALVALMGWLGLIPGFVNPSGLVGALTVGFYYEFASHRMKHVEGSNQ